MELDKKVISNSAVTELRSHEVAMSTRGEADKEAAKVDLMSSEDSILFLLGNDPATGFPTQCTLFLETLMECIKMLNDIIQTLN